VRYHWDSGEYGRAAFWLEAAVDRLPPEDPRRQRWVDWLATVRDEMRARGQTLGDPEAPAPDTKP
jgi:hypothetical protein